jgi:hypothetical protein
MHRHRSVAPPIPDMLRNFFPLAWRRIGSVK